MIKRILSVCTLLSCVFCGNAKVKYLIVEEKSGDLYSFLLADDPVITYENSNLIVNGSASTSYAIGETANFHFSENPATGVDNLSADMLSIVSIDDATIKVQNAPALAQLTLVSANGSIIVSASTDSDGEAVVSLPSTPGVYILKVAGKSIKVIRK